MKNIKTLSIAIFAIAIMLVGGFAAHKAEAATSPITAGLRLGSRGSEVTKLQTLLAQNGQIYPSGMVTGYYGSLTKNAVIQFQLAANIGVDGLVGPQTRTKLNAYILAGIGPDFMNPLVSNDITQVSNNSATVSWSTNEAARGSVYYSTTPLFGGDSESAPYEFTLSGAVASDNGNTTNHSISLNNLSPNTTYYYDIVSIDNYGNVIIVLKSTFTTN